MSRVRFIGKKLFAIGPDIEEYGMVRYNKANDIALRPSFAYDKVSFKQAKMSNYLKNYGDKKFISQIACAIKSNEINLQDDSKDIVNSKDI